MWQRKNILNTTLVDNIQQRQGQQEQKCNDGTIQHNVNQLLMLNNTKKNVKHDGLNTHSVNENITINHDAVSMKKSDNYHINDRQHMIIQQCNIIAVQQCAFIILV